MQDPSIIPGEIEEGDCLYCVAKEAGWETGPDWEWFTWVIASSIRNKPALYPGPDGRPTRLIARQKLYIPKDMFTQPLGIGYPVPKRCPCSDATATPVSPDALPTFDMRRTPSSTPIVSPTCTPTALPSPLGCHNSHLAKTIGIPLASGSFYVLFGGSGSLFVMFDVQDTSKWVVYSTAAAGVGFAARIPDFSNLKYLTQGSKGMAELYAKATLDPATYFDSLIVSEASLDEIVGGSMNLSASLFVVDVSGSLSFNAQGCSLATGSGSILSGSFGASLTIGMTDIVYDGRSGKWFPNSWW